MPPKRAEDPAKEEDTAAPPRDMDEGLPAQHESVARIRGFMTTTLEGMDESVVRMQGLMATTLKGMDAELAQLQEGWNTLQDEQASWERVKPGLLEVVKSDRIKLDVSGTIFSTTPDTLKRLPDTFFTHLVGGRFPLKLQDDGTVFIDRDPVVFRHVLNFMRGLPLKESLSEDECAQLRDDANFYNLPALSEELSATMFIFKLKFALSTSNHHVVEQDGTVATRTSNGDGSWCGCVVGEELPVKAEVVKVRFVVIADPNGNARIMVGLAPSSIRTCGAQSTIQTNTGWYLYCHNSSLHSGPPVSFSSKSYGGGNRLGVSSTIDMEVNRPQRTISFTINGQDCGVAYTDVFDAAADLCPCVTMVHQGAAVRISKAS